jgi:large subunit ribosomal protein L1
MSGRGKRYEAALEQIDRTKEYLPREALQLVKDASYANFDETVEVHIRLGVDARHADQQVRDTVQLPHGTGKEVRVLAFAEGDGERIARDAGADFIGDEETIGKIEGGWFDFDVAVATPNMMGKVGRLGRLLGPRGLMPNPKAGTVVPEDDLPRVIEELKAGRVEFRVDKTGNLHVPIGKVSFEVQQLRENLTALMEVVRRARPPSAKGTYIRRLTVSSTMGPGVRVDPFAAFSLVD